MVTSIQVEEHCRLLGGEGAQLDAAQVRERYAVALRALPSNPGEYLVGDGA